MDNLFEKYLQELHSEAYEGLDDDMPDAFDTWLETLDVNDVIEYGNHFGKKLANTLAK